jgi:hypothetical protein
MIVILSKSRERLIAHCVFIITKKDTLNHKRFPNQLVVFVNLELSHRRSWGWLWRVYRGREDMGEKGIGYDLRECGI